MTAILGYADGEHVWIGGDSAAQNGGWMRFTIRERKVWRAGDLIIGGCGRMRVIQLLHSWFQPPEHSADCGDDLDYLVVQVIPVIQRLLDEHHETMRSDESSTGLVIGYHGVVYHMDSWFNVNAVEPQIVSDGSGGDTARGAFRAFLDKGLDVEAAMLKALAIAGDFELTVAPPYYVETI